MFLATSPKELYSLDPSVSSDGIEECQEIDNQSCAKINVDFEVLKSESDIWLEGEVFKHSYTTINDDNSTSYSYNDDLDSALFLYTKKDGYDEIDGYIMTQGSEYRVNNCGDQCGNGHILLKLSEKMVQTSDLMKSPDMPDIDEDPILSEDSRGIDWTWSAENTSSSIPENSTIFISVMTYYTPEFKQEFVHPVQELKSYIAAANQAFRNSEMPIELKYFDCSFEEIDFEEIDIKDTPVVYNWDTSTFEGGCPKGGARLDAFTKAKGLGPEGLGFLLKSHDIAVLVTKHQCQDSGGMAFLGTSATSQWGGRPTLPTAWAGGGNPHVFLHEVGHIFGAGHQRSDSQSQTMTDEDTEYRYGYQMVGSAVLKEDGTEGDGKATIMSGLKKPYTIRIPYFSKDMQVPGK